MVPLNLSGRDLDPRCPADEVLGHEERVAEDFGVGGHFQVFLCRHGFPEFVEEAAVVDAEGGRDAGRELRPVLGVVAVGPGVEGVHAALGV